MKICNLTGRYLSFTGRKWNEDEATGERDLLTLLRSLQAVISRAYKAYCILIWFCTLDSSCVDDFSTDTYTGTAWGLPLSPGPLRWGVSCVGPVDCLVQLTSSKIFPCMMRTVGHSSCEEQHFLCKDSLVFSMWSCYMKSHIWPSYLEKILQKLQLAPLCLLRGINTRYAKQLLLIRLISSV